jgi:hypothetical protein
MDMISQLFGQPGQPVPPVDPEDLKTVCEFFGEIERQNPKGGVGVDMGVYQHLCKPGADIPAVAHRAAMLRLLTTPMVPKEFNAFWKKQLAPWTHDGHPDPALYREFAQLPMEWMGICVVTQGLPFDAELLRRRLSEDGVTLCPDNLNGGDSTPVTSLSTFALKVPSIVKASESAAAKSAGTRGRSKSG